MYYVKVDAPKLSLWNEQRWSNRQHFWSRHPNDIDITIIEEEAIIQFFLNAPNSKCGTLQKSQHKLYIKSETIIDILPSIKTKGNKKFCKKQQRTLSLHFTIVGNKSALYQNWNPLEKIIIMDNNNYLPKKKVGYQHPTFQTNKNRRMEPFGFQFNNLCPFSEVCLIPIRSKDLELLDPLGL